MNHELMQAYLESVRESAHPESVCIQDCAFEVPINTYALWIESLAAQVSVREVN